MRPARALAISLLLVGVAAPAATRAEAPPGSAPPPPMPRLLTAPDPGPEPAPPSPPNAGTDGAGLSATPSPSGTGGDAEPAPTEPGSETAPPATPGPAGGRSGEPRQHRRRGEVRPRFADRLGDAGRAVTPAAGFGIGGGYELTYARPAPHLDLAVGVDFSFERFATGETGTTTTSDGGMQMYDTTRLITETTFLLTQAAGVSIGPFRPYVALGAGLGVGYLSSVAAEFLPGSLRDTQLLGRGSVGLDAELGRTWSASLRVDYTAVRAQSSLVTQDGRTLPVFGDLLDIGLGAVYRF